MSKSSKKCLLDATAGIREEYIEDAAAPATKFRPLWVCFAAAAAVLALLLGGTLLLWPDNRPQAEYTPFFAIRAYAQDGTEATLNGAGDTAPIAVSQSDLFPGKEVYVLDISLTDTQGNRLDLEGSTFQCRHNGEWMEPGMTDEQISISWLENDDFYGYRIVGWCEDWDYIDITIRDKNGMILHQKTVRIEFDGRYCVDVYTSYTYEPNLTTEELIAKLFDTGQRYAIHTSIASSPYVEYRALVTHCGGFAELEERADAASLLLQRWLREMDEAEHTYLSLEYSGRFGLLLAQDAYWNNLTDEEIAMVKYRVVTRQEYEGYTPFPGKQTFSYEIKMEGSYTQRNQLSIDYEGATEQDRAAHFSIMNILSATDSESAFHGWEITGWIEKPTELTLTVTNQAGTIIRQVVLFVTPTETGYQIDILKETP